MQAQSGGELRNPIEEATEEATEDATKQAMCGLQWQWLECAGGNGEWRRRAATTIGGASNECPYK